MALNPGTPLESVEWVLEDLDMVLLMSVNPGFGGQSYIPSTVRKVKELRRLADARGLSELWIEVDGGIAHETARVAVDAGANVLVAGTAVFGQPDYRKAIAALRVR